MAQLKGADFLPYDEVIRPPLPYVQENIPSSEFNVADYDIDWEFTADESMTSTPPISKFYSYANNTVVVSTGYTQAMIPNAIDDTTSGLSPFEEPETFTITTLLGVSLISSGWGSYMQSSYRTPPNPQFAYGTGGGVAVQLSDSEGSLESWGVLG